MSFRDNVADALRIATWRAPRARTTGMTPLTAFGLFAAAILAVVMSEFLLAGVSLRTFSPYGINSIIAVTMVEALVIVAFAHIDPSSQTIRNLVLLHLTLVVIAIAERAILQTSGLGNPKAYRSLGAVIGLWLTMPAWIIWITGGARQVFRVTPGVHRPTLRGLGFALVSMISPLALPIWPVIAPTHFNPSTANLWEIVRRYEPASPAAQREAESQATEARAIERTAARLEARQGELLSAAVDALEPRDPNAPNVFTIGIAGWGDQDVFMLETQQSLNILQSRFHLGSRILSLVNNAATADKLPMASMQNIAAALRAVGARMNVDKDVLILTMTSHGSQDGFALQYDNLVERTLDPQTLKTLLDGTGIKNRILIISSCYSGGFVAPLANPDTAIITAASSTRTSFGCANDRKWTYFGKAFFEKGLTSKATMADAFKSAKTSIAIWEKEQKLTPSDPQMAIGERIAKRFPELVGPANATPAIAAAAEPVRDKHD